MNLFDEDLSETYTRESDAIQLVSYGSGTAYGYISRDSVCLMPKEVEGEENQSEPVSMSKIAPHILEEKSGDQEGLEEGTSDPVEKEKIEIHLL